MPSSPSLRLQLLGGFRAHTGDAAVVDSRWRLRKAKALVKLLALAPRKSLHREQVLEYLWPDLDPEAAINNLHQTLHAARRALEPDLRRASESAYLRWHGDLLVLGAPDGLSIDTDEFEEAAAAARAQQHPAAYREALLLYTDELLPEDRYEDWVAAHRERLEAQRLELLVELGALYMARGAVDLARETLQQAVQLAPAHEAAHRHLLRLYAQSGQRQQALAQYERLRAALQEELAAEPDPATESLYQDILASRFPAVIDGSESGLSPALAPPPVVIPLPEAATPPRRLAAPPHLPVSLTSFVGRTEELAALEAVLVRRTPATRLLTLLGPGGSGKTRLALALAEQCARAQRDEWPGGVWCVELAALADPALVPYAVAAAFGVREQASQALVDTLAGSIGEERLLLVLDNCEHLVVACGALVDRLLRACHQLHIVATSRQPLDVAGEVLWEIPPLSLPGEERLVTPTESEHWDSLRLFAERARLCRPEFSLTPENAPLVAQICRRLDGMPLAIELAAARLRVLTGTQPASRLDDLLGLLTNGSSTAPPRQQTLRNAIDWSYGLLTGPERTLFKRLSIFQGAFTLEAVEAICSSNGIAAGEILDLLTHLVEKSLVTARQTTAGTVEYVREADSPDLAAH